MGIELDTGGCKVTLNATDGAPVADSFTEYETGLRGLCAVIACRVAKYPFSKVLGIPPILMIAIAAIIVVWVPLFGIVLLSRLVLPTRV